MSAKLERVTAEIGRTKARIAENQEKLRTLERQKTDLENDQIVALFRKEKLTEDDFAAFIRSKKAVAEPVTKEEPGLEDE